MNKFEVVIGDTTGVIEADKFEVTHSGALVFWSTACRIIAFNKWNSVKMLERGE